MLKFLILLTLVFPAKSNPRVSIAGRFCSPEKYPASIATNVILDKLMEMMVTKPPAHGRLWGGRNSSKADPPQFRASWQCHEDLSPDDCSTCISAAKPALRQCLPSVSGGVYLDGCMIRYYSGDGGDERIIDTSGKIVCGRPLGRPSSEDTAMMQEFTRKVNLSVWEVAMNASGMGTGHNAVLCRGGVEDVYVLGQCWTTSSQNDCTLCLITAAEQLSGECGTGNKATEGRAMFDDCYMRYSVEKFFDIYHASEADDWTGGKIIIAGVLSSTALALITIFFVYFCYRRIEKKKRDFHCKNATNVYNSSLNFKYETLERATNYFHQSRKLGQGGSGSVFKGILPDDRIVAVKRLFFSTRQWVDEFFNEVNLIHDIEHKNLVKLLGCSIEGPESLLVYEFVPNRSLDQIIFDKKNPITTLVWEQRFDIITGTAEGLAFLHEGCGLRIIHRDVKASNVLLDKNFMPKIGDFGLARSVTNDKTHISTGIAGTLGYMAPEYLVRGQLTEKADVYAFGVLILEIVCGRRNSAFTVGSNSLLHNVWKLYKEDKVLESVDPTLRGIFNPREASNALQIGLLCTQASVSIRPTMFEVIAMLSGRVSEVPVPNQPPFLNSSMLTAENECRSDSTSQIQSEISCSFTANSSTIYDSICQASIV